MRDKALVVLQVRSDGGLGGGRKRMGAAVSGFVCDLYATGVSSTDS